MSFKAIINNCGGAYLKIPVVPNIILQFIVNRLLSNPGVLRQYAHKTVPHLYRDGHQEAIKKFTLVKIFHLIWFLDQAKNFKIIKHNPCLFNKDSPVKSSNDMLYSLSRDFLSGEYYKNIVFYYTPSSLYV